MSDEHEMTNAHDAPEESFAQTKGKGKAAAEDVHDSRLEDDDEEEEDDDDEDDDDDYEGQPEAADQDEEDGMEEMDLNNVIYGRRTRGCKIDFAKAAEELGPEGDDDEDEEEDDDFQPPAEDTEMAD